MELTDKTSSYVLSVDDDGSKLLEMQNIAFAEQAFKQLDQAKLKAGMTAWDIGCGNGFMTEYLAKAVGPKGKIYAFDYSTKQLTRTKARLEAANLYNVEYISGDIQQQDKLSFGKADLIYSRFLLMHLTNPLIALGNMHKILKSGGVIVLQESTFSSLDKTKTPKSIYEITQTLIKLGNQKNVDYNIGEKLTNYCQISGFKNITAYKKEFFRSFKETCSFFIHRLDEMQSVFLDSKFIDKQTLTQWYNDLEYCQNKTDDELISLGEQSYIIAWNQ